MFTHDFLINYALDRNSEGPLCSSTFVFGFLGHFFSSKFQSICPGEFFEIGTMAWVDLKSASKIFFKCLSCTNTSKYFIFVKSPSLLWTHHLVFRPKNFFSINFQILENFLKIAPLWCFLKLSIFEKCLMLSNRGN